jgi:hypothetical protein
MQSVKTCVILVSYRGAEDTAACVRSLLQSQRAVEIVVVDNTPHDPALAPALAFAPTVTLIRADTNTGFGGGNNIGIQWAAQHSRCDYIFLLNNDTVIYPETIARLEEGMNAHPEASILVPRIAYLDHPDLLWYGGGDVDWKRISVSTPGINGSATAPLAMQEREVSFATGCALFVRRPAMRQLRGFDPRFFMYEEDVDLCLRAREQGLRILYLPDSLLLHRIQGSSRGPNQDRTNFWATDNPRLPFLCYHVVRNRVLNLLRHAHGKDRCLALLFFPLYLLRRALPFLRHGRLDAILAMLRGIHAGCTVRHPVPIPEWTAE